MKKALVLILMVLILFAGCEISNDGNNGNDTDKVEVTLRVLNYLDADDPDGLNEITEVWDKFSAEHPEIHIIREDLFNKAFHEKTAAYLAADNLPDVIYMWPAQNSTPIHMRGAVKDLMPLIKRDGLVDSYIPASLSPQAAGYLGMLPSGSTSTHMMYANLKVLRENGLKLPGTMQDLIDMVPVLKAKGIEVIGMDNEDAWVMESCLFSLIAGRFGGASWYDDLVEGKIDFSDEWFLKALKTVETLYEEGVIDRSTIENAYGASRKSFAEGKCAFFIDGDWACCTNYEGDSSFDKLFSREQQKNDLALTVFPAIEGEKFHNTTSGVVTSGFGINSKLVDGTPEAEAAWTLVKYLQGKHVQEYRLKTGSGFPSNKKVDIAKVVKENDLDPIVGKRAEFYGKWMLTPVIDSVFESDVFIVINDGLQDIGRGNKTAEQVAEETNAAWLSLKK